MKEKGGNKNGRKCSLSCYPRDVLFDDQVILRNESSEIKLRRSETNVILAITFENKSRKKYIQYLYAVCDLVDLVKAKSDK